MRKSIFIGSFILLACASCHKAPMSNSQLQLKLNNVSYLFDSMKVWVDTINNFRILSIDAKSRSENIYLSASLQSNVPLMTGAYSHLNPQPQEFIVIGFVVGVTQGQNEYIYTVEGAPFVFTIQNSVSNTIQGSFSGKISQVIGTETPDINGSFNLPYQYR